MFSGNFLGKSCSTFNFTTSQIIVFGKLKKLKFSLPQMISSKIFKNSFVKNICCSTFRTGGYYFELAVNSR